MEHAAWIDWGEIDTAGGYTRVYAGDECRQECMPLPEAALSCAAAARRAGKEFTLVTPFLTERGVEAALRLVETLAREADALEVVCNDWGLFLLIAEQRRCEPVVGRLLARQDTDPRIAEISNPAYQARFEREVQHADGTVALLKHGLPPEALLRHSRRCSLDSPAVLGFLKSFGARRFEVSNVRQGILLNPPEGWRATLHVPRVLISAVRDAAVVREEWRHDSFPVALERATGGVYYAHADTPPAAANMGIDRVVTFLKSAA